MGAQQGKMQGQLPPVGYQGTPPMPPPPPPLPGAIRADGSGGGGTGIATSSSGTHPPRQVSKIKGLKPRQQGQHHQSAPRSPLASAQSGGVSMTAGQQAMPASPLATNIFAEHTGKIDFNITQERFIFNAILFN